MYDADVADDETDDLGSRVEALVTTLEPERHRTNLVNPPVLSGAENTPTTVTPTEREEAIEAFQKAIAKLIKSGYLGTATMAGTAEYYKKMAEDAAADATEEAAEAGAQLAIALAVTAQATIAAALATAADKVVKDKAHADAVAAAAADPTDTDKLLMWLRPSRLPTLPLRLLLMRLRLMRSIILHRWYVKTA